MTGILAIYERPDGKWGWRLRGDNNFDIVATDGSQGYESETECARMADKVVDGHYTNATRIRMPLEESA